MPGVSTRRGDRGFTLVELLVVVVLVGVMGTVFFSTVVQATRVDERTRGRADAQEAVTLALERVSKEVRVAAPLVTASGTQLAVDVYPAQPAGTTLRHRHSFTIAAGQLTQQTDVFSPATATAPTSTSTRVLAGSLSDVGSEFVLRDRSGATTSDPVKVASVEISLRRTTSTSKPFEATTTVFLRNYKG